MLFALLIGCSTYGSTTSLEFPRANPDSVVAIEASREGYTSRSTKAILIRMKNGNSVTALRDEGGGISPMTLSVVPGNAWFSVANPKWAPKKGNCEELLCNVAVGMCKCMDAIADSGFTLNGIPESMDAKWVLIDKNGIGRKKKKAKVVKLDILLTEPEVKKRFHGDCGGALKIE